MGSKIEIFNIDDDLIIYLERLEIWFNVNAVKAEQKANLLLTSLCTTVYKMLRNAFSPKLLSGEKFEDLVAELKNQFVKRTVVFKERRRFYDAKQLPGEKSLEYFNRIKALAINCDFKTTIDEILLDKFVTGLMLGPTFERICEEKTVTLDKCLEIAASREIEGLECNKIINQHVLNHQKNRHHQQNRHQQQWQHGKSNGQAENSVNTFKFGFSKMIEDPMYKGRSIDDVIEAFLYMNRNAVHCETKKTPFEMMFDRKAQLRWQKLIPVKQQTKEVKSNVRNFSINDKVYMKNFNNDKWQLAFIFKILGVNSYLVKSNNKIYKRHANHLSKFINDNDGVNNEFAPGKIIDNDTMYQKNLKQVLTEPVACLSRGNDEVEQGLEDGRSDVADPVDTEVNIDSNVQINDNNVSSNVPVVVNVQNTDGRPQRIKKKPIKLDL